MIASILLYLISFGILFLAEICQTLHSLFIVRDNKHKAALTGAISSALWCIKIVVVINQPLTILTAFLGAWLGSYCAFEIEKKLSK